MSTTWSRPRAALPATIPHGGPNPRLLNRANVNTICLQCHSPSPNFTTSLPTGAGAQPGGAISVVHHLPHQHSRLEHQCSVLQLQRSKGLAMTESDEILQMSGWVAGRVPLSPVLHPYPGRGHWQPAEPCWLLAAEPQPDAAKPAQQVKEKKPATEPAQKIVGGYLVHQTVELGGRIVANKSGQRRHVGDDGQPVHWLARPRPRPRDAFG